MNDTIRIGTLTVEEAKPARIYSEYAAWWTDVELVPGTYELRLDRQSTGWVRVAIDSIITHESNATHYGGVAMGPSTQRRTGQPTTYFDSMYVYSFAKAYLEGTLDWDVTLDEGVEVVSLDYAPDEYSPNGHVSADIITAAEGGKWRYAA